MCATHDREKVAIAGFILGEEHEMVVPLAILNAPISPIAGRNVDLATEDRLDLESLSLSVELDRAAHDAMIGQREGIHLALASPRQQSRDFAGGVEDAVLGVNVQMNEWAAHGSCS
jgi:hypothetical protein